MSRAKDIQFQFIPEEFRISREIYDEENNLIDSRNASPKEAIELDPDIMTDVIDFAEQTFPQLFTGLSTKSGDGLFELKTKLSRMLDSLEAYISYRKNQSRLARRLEPGYISGTVIIDGSVVEGITVDINSEIEDEYSNSAVTDNNGIYNSEKLYVGNYIVTVKPDELEEQSKVVEVQESTETAVDFDFNSES